MHFAKLLTAIAVPALLAAPVTQAAGFPEKPVRLIIGSAPGSGPDIISRLVSDRLYQTWNQRIVVDSRPGAAGAISADLTLQAAPDGYTWMMLTSQLFVASQVLTNLKFNLDKDFQSIALIGTVPFILLANPTLPAKSVKDLIDLAKKSPGKIRYGSAGTGASEHLSGVLLTQLTKTDMLHVPYKGVAQAIIDTIANEVQITYAVLPAALPHITSGRLRALGVTPPKRAPLLPDVPAIAESVPGYAMYGWYSIVAPKGTPAAILNQVSAEVVKAAKEPAFAERLKSLGIEVVAGDRKVLDDWRRDETKRVSELVKVSGAKGK
ncbi:MAG: tripartite tricarboxylate transporter substrate-binding protein [Betaproteobacteria bacterium]|jgi:tripartite-type tricarboxylate transporter receptor subunit TctC|nr:tripartite tricarboxylate transporter substrate-binding protein [Betaproteobacteria bacterium]